MTEKVITKYCPVTLMLTRSYDCTTYRIFFQTSMMKIVLLLSESHALD